jgi:hypothetical protein
MTQYTSQAPAIKKSIALAWCCAWLALPAAAQQAAREQGAATQRQAQKTDSANRAAAVEDETSAAAQAARTAQSETARFEAAQSRSGSGNAAPSYGPTLTLTPRGRQPADAMRKDPAEVHDETDTLTRPAPATGADPASSQRQTANPNLRRPARQPAATPMAPRPLRTADAADTFIPEPVPAPSAPRPVITPSPAIIGSCQGNSCLDTNGRRYNGIGIGTGNAGVNGSGQLCVRTGNTVQCH